MRSSAASAAVVGVLIGFAGVLVLFRPHPPAEARPLTPRAAAAPARAVAPAVVPVPADAALSNSLFERNRAMPSDPDLAAEYDTINDEFFSNILPAPQVRWESGLADLGPTIADGFTVQGLTDGRMILLNPAIEHDADQRRRALCHEMVHMAVWAEDREHGPVFQERLRQLSLRGAFKGIVATEQEKDAALAALHDQRTAIEAEEHALATDRATLDRTSAAAVDGFNARVHRQQAAVADYNRLVEQYNLMVSYPDGLARERMATRADGTRPDR